MADPVNSSDEAVTVGDLRLLVMVTENDDERIDALNALCVAVRAEAVADERRRCPSCSNPVVIAPRWQEWACSDPGCRMAHGDAPGGGWPLAAGSVPVATPPAEPAAQIHDANCEQQLGACCCHCQKRADVAFSHAAPSQPVTCEACAEIGCSHSGIDDETGLCWCCGWCPGPVSVPKESSE